MSYLTSLVLIHFNAGHFNGIGTEGSGKYAKSAIKKYEIDGKRIPFISAQSIRKYIRNYIELTTHQPNYYDRVFRKTTKKDFVIVDPIEFFEDDYFGFSHPLYENPNPDAVGERLKVASMNRRSPFLCNGLIGINGLATFSDSEGWVHPNYGTPLPYRSEFSSGYFQGSMSLEIDRIGIFKNYGDVIEMDPNILEIHKESIINRKDGLTSIYEVKERKERLTKSISFYFDSIINLSGGAKSTMFADSLSPCLLISAKLKCSNSLPNNLFIMNSNGNIDINYPLLFDFLDNWKEYFSSPLIIGYRSSTFAKEEEIKLLSYDGKIINDVSIKVTNIGNIKNVIMGEGYGD